MKRKLMLLALGLALPLLAGAEPGYVAETAQLRDGPNADAKLLQSLAAATAVDVLARQGGWYQVSLAGQQGWLRMSALRLHTPVARAGLLEGGRGAATQSVSNTGVRGFGSSDLEAASPDLPAADALVPADPAGARSFAAAGGLQANTTGKGGAP
jgi:Bacterial SH3 domain